MNASSDPQLFDKYDRMNQVNSVSSISYLNAPIPPILVMQYSAIKLLLLSI